MQNLTLLWKVRLPPNLMQPQALLQTQVSTLSASLPAEHRAAVQDRARPAQTFLLACEQTGLSHAAFLHHTLMHPYFPGKHAASTAHATAQQRSRRL